MSFDRIEANTAKFLKLQVEPPIMPIASTFDFIGVPPQVNGNIPFDVDWIQTGVCSFPAGDNTYTITCVGGAALINKVVSLNIGITEAMCRTAGFTITVPYSRSLAGGGGLKLADSGDTTVTALVAAKSDDFNGNGHMHFTYAGNGTNNVFKYW